MSLKREINAMVARLERQSRHAHELTRASNDACHLLRELKSLAPTPARDRDSRWGLVHRAARELNRANAALLQARPTAEVANALGLAKKLLVDALADHLEEAS